VISEVEVIELQHYDLILLCLNCAYPLREVRSDHGVLELSLYTITIHYVSQRQDVIEQYGWNQFFICSVIFMLGSLLC
jgi:hypothetical protein